MINIIYGLRDPRNDVYQYIGKSSVGSKRALQHLKRSHSERVNKWILGLEENWLYPIIDIIEEVDDVVNLAEREKYWIEYYYVINPDLLNIHLMPSSIQNIRTEEDEAKFLLLCDVMSSIHNILKKERIYRNLSQDKLAKEMGVARSTISLLENGHNTESSMLQKYVLVLKGHDIIHKHNPKRARDSSSSLIK